MGARVIMLVLALLSASGGAAEAQTPRSPTADDSVAAFRAARRAQTRFEAVRRAGLPVRTTHALACDTHVGRYCYWHDSTARPPVPREGARVAPARRALLHTLDSVGTRWPGDRWVLGQRVRYRLDGGDTLGAVRITREGCHSTPWWCAALRGYASHVAGDHASAELAFADALALMPERQRCEWDDPGVLLEPDARARLADLPCDARRPLARRAWWLAQPLLSMSNDLRTELLARRTVGELEADARLIYETSWGWDTRELLLRYGWPVWWTRQRLVSASGSTLPQLAGHERTPSWSFAPAAAAIFDTTAPPAANAWAPDVPLPASRYGPAYARRWATLDAQVARFRRGDTLLVVAAFTPSGAAAASNARPTVVLSGGPDGPVVQGDSMPARGIVVARSHGRSLNGMVLAGVEVVDTTDGGSVARWRAGLAPLLGGRIGVSDLLLVDAAAPDAGASATLEGVLPYLHASPRVGAGRLGLYWETYGLAASGEPLEIAVSLERIRVPRLRRAAERLGLATRAQPVRVQWREQPDGATGIAARYVVIGLSELASGAYRIRLTVHAGDGPAASAERVIDVAR